jgi:hypothetical protein
MEIVLIIIVVVLSIVLFNISSDFLDKDDGGEENFDE